MTASRTIAIRLTLDEADQFRAAIKASGADGDAAFKRIADGAAGTAAALDGLNAKVASAQGQLRAMAEEAARSSQASVNALLGVKAPTNTDDYRKRAADIEAYGQRLDGLRAKYDPLFAASKQYEAGLAEIAEGQKAGALSAAQAQAAQERLRVAYEKANAPLGDQRARADAMQAETAAAARLRAAIVPLAAAEQAHAEQLARIGQAEKTGVISAVEATVARDRAGKSLKEQTVGLGETAATGKLAGYQLQQLTAETHKFADQILAGGSAVKAFVFQAPNMVSSAGGMKNAVAAITNIFTPFRLGALVAVGGIAALVVAAESADARMVKLRNGLVAYTDDYASIAERIDRSSRQQAAALNLPTGEVRSAQTAITVALPTLNGEDVQKAVELGHKLALTLDKDLGAAMERLAGLARDPSAAIKQMAEQGIAGLSAQLVRNIDLLQRSGDRVGAYRLAAEALTKTLGGAEMTQAEKATASLKSEFDSLWKSIADGLAGPGASLTAWLAANLKDIRESSQRGDFMPAEPVIPEWAQKPLIRTGSSNEDAKNFATTYGPPIGANASARGLDPQVALAVAALESRFGQQTAGGANNPFNITAAPGQNATTSRDNQNGQTYSFRNFASIGEATNAFIDLIERKYPGLKDAGRDPAKVAAALRVGEQGGYAEGIGSTVEEKRKGYADGLAGAMRTLGLAPGSGGDAARDKATTQTASAERDRGRDLGAGQFGPPVARVDEAAYSKAADAARSTLEGRRQSLRADIGGTERMLQEAQTRGDQGTADLLTARLRDQRAELEKLRSPVQDYVKGLQDQSAAAKQDSGSAGEVAKALADLNKVGKDSNWQVTAADRAEVTRLTLERLSAGYAKAQAEIRRSTAANDGQATAWLRSDAAAREAEARQKAVTEARQFFKEGSADYVAAVEAGTKANLGLAASLADVAAGQRVASDRKEMALTAAERRLLGSGADATTLELTRLKAEQDNEAATPALRAAAVDSAMRKAQQTLDFTREKTAIGELSSFADSAFDKVGSSITSAFAEGKAAAIDFGSIGKAVISELSQELIKLAVINPLKNAVLGQNSALPTIGSVGTSLLGSLFGGGNAIGATGVTASVVPVTAVPLNHTGGIAGFEATSTRAISSSYFTGAPRYHTGGIAGDEVPSVLRAGEGVFTQGQMRALGAGMSANGADPGGDTHLHLNIDARGAGPREIDELRNQIPGLALASVQNSMQRGGRFAQQVRGGRR